MAVFHGFDPSVRERIVTGHAETNGNLAVMTVATEQYRRLAATLHHAQMEKGLKIVMVVSSMAGEGKTLTATNLALTLSESYQRQVLLVDADLRRPSLHRVFGLPNATGLNEALTEEAGNPPALFSISPQLTLLAGGRPHPDPMAVLTSDRMRRLMEEAAAGFDWVVVDTPPVGLLPDANLLAAMVHAAVLVVEAGKTDYASVQRAVAAIGRDKIIGIVLNRAERPAGTYGNYERYYAGYAKRTEG